MRKYSTHTNLVGSSKKEPLFSKFLNKDLPFGWTTTWAYTPANSDEVMLTSVNDKYTDDISRHTKITFKNANGKEVYSDEEFLLKHPNGDERFLNIDIGCFDLFFGVIYHFEDKIDGKQIVNVGLKAYDYDGELIGNFEPDASLFKFYSLKQLKDFELKVTQKKIENEIAQSKQQ